MQEEERLKSFKNWPASHIMAPKRLADAGFSYLGVDDITECVFCNGIIGEWKTEDDPSAEHQQKFPHCPFVKDVIRPRLLKQISLRDSTENDSHSFENLGINEYRPPKYSRYVTYEERLKTYANWPKSIAQKPEILADAGFAYTNLSDKVTCFSCGGGLMSWMPLDDPWIEHAKHYPHCNYVILSKGREFIRRCRENDGEQQQPSNVNAEANKENPTSTNQIDNVSEENSSFPPKEEPLSPILCKICTVNEVGIVFLPCGHLVVCAKCAVNLKICPVCEKFIKATVKTFLT